MTPDSRAAETTANGTYADVNGIHLYYESHGAGRPLILLHGGLGSGEMFGPTLPALAAKHQVIAVDLQGHGRTADIGRPIDPRLMSGDIAALIGHLGLDRPDVMGYSLGGAVAFWTAVDHPDLVRRLIVLSTNMRRDAIYPDMLGQQSQVSAAAVPFLKDTPMYEGYMRVAPRPGDFGQLLDKMGAGMAKDFDFSAEVSGLQVPTLIACADADMAPPAHYVEVFGLLDGGKRDGGWQGEGRPAGGHVLAIIPGRTHYDVHTSPVLVTAVLEFLATPEG